MKKEKKIIIKYNHVSEREHNGLTTSKNSELWYGVHAIDKTCNTYSVTRITQRQPYWESLHKFITI
jgi:hypothetical protein